MLAHGSPREVMTEGRLRKLFDTDLIVDENPVSGAPRVTIAGVMGRGSEVRD
jgi:ABC-type hemin transport system ATPase subunit